MSARSYEVGDKLETTAAQCFSRIGRGLRLGSGVGSRAASSRSSSRLDDGVKMSHRCWDYSLETYYSQRLPDLATWRASGVNHTSRSECEEEERLERPSCGNAPWPERGAETGAVASDPCPLQACSGVSVALSRLSDGRRQDAATTAGRTRVDSPPAPTNVDGLETDVQTDNVPQRDQRSEGNNEAIKLAVERPRLAAAPPPHGRAARYSTLAD
ncbi:hypothetical protein OPT61_g5675 [Boeremia exigua]|uniref:Uncharacterized protein n=1 Tax=Boeremia exigua TaxID=749465 RepID=A0ACC2I9G1_9PLEO|nr:hypothetical protein OPT61_g5675 [Boeremia exigua]